MTHTPATSAPRTALARGRLPLVVRLVGGLASLGVGLTAVVVGVPLVLLAFQLFIPLGLYAGVLALILGFLYLVGQILHGLFRMLADLRVGLLAGAAVLLAAATVVDAGAGPGWGVVTVLATWAILAIPRAALVAGGVSGALDETFSAEPLELGSWRGIAEWTDDALGLVTLMILGLFFAPPALVAAPALQGTMVGAAALLAVVGILAASARHSHGAIEVDEEGRVILLEDLAPEAREEAGLAVSGLGIATAPGECSYCGDGLAGAANVLCVRCLTPHHQDCWRELGRCTTYACPGTRTIRAVRAA